MSDDRSRRAGVPEAETAESKVKGTEPFERFKKSRSGGDYDPDSNWAAERRTDAVKAKPNADVLGQVRGSTERLVDQSLKAVEQGRTPQRTEPDGDDSSGK